MMTRITPKRVVVKPWPFGFRVSDGHLKVDVGGGDPPEITFVNRTGFDVEFRFDPPFLANPSGGGPLPVLSLPVSQPQQTYPLLDDAEGKFEYQARVMVRLSKDIEYIEASGGSRPDVDIQR